jgi:clan AA aspartic protease (TIGR02281 family)
MAVAAALPPDVGAASSAEALNEGGKAAYANGDFVTALDLFSRALAQDPAQALFHYHRAVALTRLHRWQEAKTAYARAQQLAPPPPLAALIRDGLRSLPPTAPKPRPPSGEVVSVGLRPFRGVWLAEVVINDGRSAGFVVDTGATLCVLSPALAEAVGIRPERDARTIELQTLNRRASGRLVSIPALRVGAAEATGVLAVILDVGSGLDGILGNSFLAQFAVALDAERGVLHLRPRRLGGESRGPMLAKRAIGN